MEQPFPRPGHGEAAAYFDRYIGLVPEGDIVAVLAAQLEPSLALFRSVSADKSLCRYADEKWSIRQMLNHISDTERVMLSRAYWFARGFPDPMPGMDQDIAAAAARADEVDWEAHIGEFRTVREATLSFLRNLPAEAWPSRGVASGNPVTVRGLAYIIAGHNLHHQAILRARYL